MLRSRSGVERLGAPLAEAMQGKRWNSRYSRFQSSLQVGVDGVKDGRSAQACCTFLLARRGWKDVCRKQSKCCRISPAAAEMAIQCRDSAHRQNERLTRWFQDAMRSILRLIVGAVEPHCAFRGGANCSIAPPTDRTSAEQAHSQHQPNLDLTTL